MAEIPRQLAQALADRYTLERELGAGGMATVYLAHDRKLGRPVALKVLRPELAAALGPERFLREIEIAAKLAHPHILALHDCSEAGGLLYYTMPYVEGESLRDRLAREKQLPLEDALQITREVAGALGYAHALGLVHRDIKPENILFQAGHALVADFGIAKAVSAAGRERLTETGLAIGTPAYMSPEQAAGDTELDGRSDLYSLGCVLYEMLSGETPYTGPSAQAVLAKKLSEPLPHISVVREAVPAGVEAVLNKVLAKTAADRYRTATEFTAALAHPATVGASVTGGPRTAWRRRAVRLALGVAAIAVLVAAVAVGRRLLSGGMGARHPRAAVAVLPFENLSGEGPNAYFAGGLHDELLTQLAKVAALSVRARTSVMGYAGTTKPLRQIAEELSAGSIVEGSVQVLGNRLRVIVQLIDPVSESHVWAETYDRTLDDAFAVQSEIAQRIVEAVGATLTSAEAGAIAAAPTRNAEAYRLYLQGLEYVRRPGNLAGDLVAAEQVLERAVALDQGFALAHALLADVHGAMYWWRYDPTPARAALQRREAEAALRLGPTLPQAHLAIGMVYYRGMRDYPRALGELNAALGSAPNDASLWAAVGAVHRRLGNWDSVDVSLAKVMELDPLDVTALVDLGAGSYLATRRYADAARMIQRAVAIAPDLRFIGYQKGTIYVVWKGDLDTLRVFLRSLPPSADIGGGGGTAGDQLAELLLWEHQPDSLLALLPLLPGAVFDRQEAYRPHSLYAAWAHLLRGDSVAARAAFASAVAVLDSAVRLLPDDWRVHAARGQALAGVGRREEAQREARWLERSVVYRTDRSESPFLADERAQILARIGERDAAIAEIERILAGPSWTTSVHTLRLDPRWDPIRDDPRFQALLVKYGDPERR